MNYSKMSKQEIFEVVAKHLFEQGKQAKVDNAYANRDEGDITSCVLLNKEGCMCAVGKVLEDLSKEERLNKMIWDSSYPVFKRPDVKIMFQPNIGTKVPADFEHCFSLVNVHDYNRNWKSTQAMRIALHTFASIHQLDATFVDTLSFKDK